MHFDQLISTYLTDNLHSEIFNLFALGGVIALSLYLYYVFELFRAGSASKVDQLRRKDFRWILFALVSVIMISSLVNSTIKDFGEKHLLIAIFALLGAYVRLKGDLRDGRS